MNTTHFTLAFEGLSGKTHLFYGGDVTAVQTEQLRHVSTSSSRGRKRVLGGSINASMVLLDTISAHEASVYVL